MNYAHSVAVGPKFFRKAFNDYSNHHWAFAREIMQNSLDCGSTRIEVTITDGLGDDGEPVTYAAVANNGEPMTRETLVGKLLALRESGKDFHGAVGGFGKAKEVLYFAHKAYKIVSGGHYVLGSGAGYDLGESYPDLHGTFSFVTWDGHHAETLTGQFGLFVRYCGLGDRVAFTINGETVKPALRPGDPVRTLDDAAGQPWAEVRLGKTEPGVFVVRVGGIPMFWDRCDYKGAVVLELLGTSAQRLTANRDGLKYPHSNQLREFVTTIAVDKRTAFVLEKAEYRRTAGAKLGRPRPTRDVIADLDLAVAGVPEPTGGADILVSVLARTEAPAVGLLGHEFIIKNCVRKPVPKEFDPEGLAFGDYAHWLVRAWAGCLLELYDLHEVDDPFSVGFVFSDKVEAESERSGEYGQVYYLNPCRVTRKGHTRRFKKGARFGIVADAAHEFVHGALGESYHGEDYATRLTEVMATVMKHGRRFTRHLG